MQQSSRMRHQNSNAKHLVRYCIFTSIILISLFVYLQRHTIFFYIGNAAFGETIAGHTFYNLSVAEKFLTKANKAQRPREWTNYQLSRINFIKGDLQRAVFFANNELKLYPNNCRTHYIRGLSYGYMERLDNAISDFEIFNTCFPNTWAGHNDLAWFWFRKGNMNKVISIAEEAFKNNSTNATSPWLQNTYGTALMNVGRYLEADNALRMAQYLAGNMTEHDWGKAYPGNDPLIYGKGLESMRTTINNNILILKEKMGTATATPVTIHR